jgi:hypothetical protein
VSDRAPLDAADWARVSAIFHRALAAPPAERAAVVDAGCGDDERVAAEVTSLLGAHDRAAGWLDATAGGVLPAIATPASSGRQTPSIAATLASGDRVGPYRIDRVLGAGGMGIVYLAEDTRLGRPVALKALPDEATDDDTRRARLRREARAAASLVHPGIATVYALDEIAGRVYIAAEYLAGGTLRDELANGPLPIVRALDTAIGLADALDAAHRQGVVHRDVKPENIMRDATGATRIVDFGLARMADATGRALAPTLGDAAFGTPAYMAPEQIRAEPTDARTDIFAAGVVLFELATGRTPFSGVDAAATMAIILEREPVRLRDAAPAAWPVPVVDALDRLISACLQKAPADRLSSAAELADGLRHVRAALDSGDTRALDRIASAPPPSATEAEARWWWQFHQATAAIIYLLLLFPLWRATPRLGSSFGPALAVAAVVAAVVSGALRLHLWFAARLYPAEWRSQYSRAGAWIRAADVVFTLTLAGAGVLAMTSGTAGLGVLLLAAAAAVLVSFAIIEPATTRAAFTDRSR